MSDLEVDKLYSYSTQLSIKLQLLIKTKTLKKIGISYQLSYDVFILLINVKMPTIVGTIVGILTFISRINFMLS